MSHASAALQRAGSLYGRPLAKESALSQKTESQYQQSVQAFWIVESGGQTSRRYSDVVQTEWVSIRESQASYFPYV